MRIFSLIISLLLASINCTIIKVESLNHFNSFTGLFVVLFYSETTSSEKNFKKLNNHLEKMFAPPSRVNFLQVNVDKVKDIAQSFGIDEFPSVLAVKGDGYSIAFQGIPDDFKITTELISSAIKVV